MDKLKVWRSTGYLYNFRLPLHKGLINHKREMNTFTAKSGRHHLNKVTKVNSISNGTDGTMCHLMGYSKKAPCHCSSLSKDMWLDSHHGETSDKPKLTFLQNNWLVIFKLSKS